MKKKISYTINNNFCQYCGKKIKKHSCFSMRMTDPYKQYASGRDFIYTRGTEGCVKCIKKMFNDFEKKL